MGFKFNAKLDFNASDAVRGMATVSKGFSNVKEGADKLKKGLEGVTGGLQAAALATAPLGIAVGFGVKQSAEFEKQLAGVRGELMVTKDAMKPLETQIRTLGATGADMKELAAASMEFANAGFAVEDITKALPDAITMMKAANMDGATATKAITGTMKAFSLEAKDTKLIIDTLAFTAAATNTEVNELADALASAGDLTDVTGNLQQTAMAMGVLSEMNIKGSAATGALRNAFVSLSNPSKEIIKLFGGSQKAMDDAIFTTVNGQKQFKSMEVVMANLSKVVSSAKDPMEALKVTSDLFGIKGGKAFKAFEKQLLGTTVVSENNIEKIRAGIKATGDDMKVNIGDSIPSLVAMKLQIAGAAGAAKEIANANMDNAADDFKKLLNITKNLNAEAGNMLLQTLKPLIKDAISFGQVLGVAFQVASGRISEADAATALGDNSLKHFLGTAIEFSKGFIAGFGEVKESLMGLFNFGKQFFASFSSSTGMTAADFGKLAAKIFFIGAAFAPIAAGLLAGFAFISKMVGFVIGSVNMLTGTFQVLWGVGQVVVGGITALAGALGAPFWLVAAAIAGIIAVLYIFRKEIFDTFVEAFNVVKNVFINPSKETFMDLGAFIISTILQPFKILMSTIKGAIGGIARLFGFSKEGVAEFMNTGIMGAMGNKALDKAFLGTPKSQMQPEIVNTNVRASEQANQAITEQIKQKSLVQPPSAEEVASASAQASRMSGGGQSSQSGTMTMTGKLETKISGNDLNIILTRAQVSQAERNGRSIDPAEKRRMMQNGQQAYGY